MLAQVRELLGDFDPHLNTTTVGHMKQARPYEIGTQNILLLLLYNIVKDEVICPRHTRKATPLAGSR